MTKVSNFIKEVTARLKGDEAGVVAAKNERKAVAAVKGQLAALDNQLVNQESAVEDANEAFEAAKYPTNLIGDVESYVRNIANKKEHLAAKEEALEETKKSIEFFKGLLVEFSESK